MFTRVKPGNWAVGEELTSAQMNTLDIDHANAVDKTGDTISGTIHVSGSGKVSADLHDTIVSTVDSGISTTVSRGISINNDNGLSLDTAGAWPSFRSTRGYTRRFLPSPWNQVSTGFSTNWDVSIAYLTSTASNNTFTLIFDITDQMHHGATLASLDVWLSVTGPHSAVPATLPKVDIRRQQALVVGAAFTISDAHLLSTNLPVAFPTPASGAAWDSSNQIQKWTYTCDQNNTIDRTAYRYYVQLSDEQSSNSVSGNRYLGFTANYTGIANMQFR